MGIGRTPRSRTWQRQPGATARNQPVPVRGTCAVRRVRNRKGIRRAAYFFAPRTEVFRAISAPVGHLGRISTPSARGARSGAAEPGGKRVTTPSGGPNEKRVAVLAHNHTVHSLEPECLGYANSLTAAVHEQFGNCFHEVAPRLNENITDILHPGDNVYDIASPLVSERISRPHGGDLRRLTAR